MVNIWVNIYQIKKKIRQMWFNDQARYIIVYNNIKIYNIIIILFKIAAVIGKHDPD